MKPKPKLVATTKITIDKDVPPPLRGHQSLKYPWPDMSVGDSFVVPEGTPLPQVRSAAYGAGIRYGKKFIVGPDPQGQFRVWRMAGIAAAAVAFAYAMPAHAYSWQMWGHEACGVKYTLAGKIWMVTNGCSPNVPGLNGAQGSATGTWFRMEGPYATKPPCDARAQAVIAEDPPYTNATCIEFNN